MGRETSDTRKGPTVGPCPKEREERDFLLFQIPERNCRSRTRRSRVRRTRVPSGLYGPLTVGGGSSSGVGHSRSWFTSW